ncbi:hypothetical protein J1614_002431 [Plenodomus biglobosus]|nr:hypothetical protein J1614_002431 [Plenodomus biglobosus]
MNPLSNTSIRNNQIQKHSNQKQPLPLLVSNKLLTPPSRVVYPPARMPAAVWGLLFGCSDALETATYASLLLLARPSVYHQKPLCAPASHPPILNASSMDRLCCTAAA